jgi:hypothetical protein
LPSGYIAKKSHVIVRLFAFQWRKLC